MKRRVFRGLCCAAAGLMLTVLCLGGCKAPGSDPEGYDRLRRDGSGVSEPDNGSGFQEETPDGTKRREFIWDGSVELPPKEEGIYTLEEVLFAMLAQTDADSNLLISPYSLRCVLTSLYHSTDGEAREEMAAFLGYDGSDESVYEEQEALRREVLKGREGIELSLADSFWIRETFGGESIAGRAKDLSDRLRERYGCEIFPTADFGDGTLERMNGWVEEKTNGMIRRIVDSLDEETILVLMNALYFNGTWTTVFEPRDTQERYFYGYKIEGEGETVPFMSLEDASFRYWEGEGYVALELPYGKDGEIVMDVILAEGGTDLDYSELFSEGGETLKKVLAGLDGAELADIYRLSIPKWEEDHTIAGLSEVFRAAGLENIFKSGGMSQISEWARVDSILQKTAIEVTEHGTKAAAVSAVVTEGAGLITDEKFFIADHNFAYVIREKTEDTMLFVGLVNQLS